MSSTAPRGIQCLKLCGSDGTISERGVANVGQRGVDERSFSGGLAMLHIRSRFGVPDERNNPKLEQSCSTASAGDGSELRKAALTGSAVMIRAAKSLNTA